MVNSSVRWKQPAGFLIAKHYNTGGAYLVEGFDQYRHSIRPSPRRASDFNRTLKELLQDAEAKDRLIAGLDNLEPQRARELAKIVLWSDSAFSFGLLGQLPHGLNYLIAFLDELGLQLQNIPDHLLREFVSQMANKVDFAALQELPRNYVPLIETLSADNNDQKAQELAERIKGIDFGKFRSKMNKKLETHYPLMETLVCTIIEDPVIFANLLNILPSIINHILKGTARALQSIDYPPEILASALFNLADDLEAEKIGSIINNLNRIINDLHKGSALLGRPDPRFRTVLQSFFYKSLADVDSKEAAAALLALGEDFEVFCLAVVETAAQRPQPAADILSGLLQSSGAVLRGVTVLLENHGRLSADLNARLALELNRMDYAVIAAPINALIGACNRLLIEDPALLTKIINGITGSLDLEELKKLSAITIQQSELFSWSSLARLFPPAAVKETLNSNLKNLNRKLVEEPGQLKTLARPYLIELDQEELAQILLFSSAEISETLAENPRLSRSLVKAFFRLSWGLIRGAIKRNHNRGRNKDDQ